MTPLEITIAMRLPSAANLREHWAVRATRERKQREWTRLALAGRPAREWRRAHLPATGLKATLTRVGERRLDSDNVARAFKSIRDQVAEWAGVDDGDEGCEGFWTWEYTQERGLYAVRIRLEAR